MITEADKLLKCTILYFSDDEYVRIKNNTDYSKGNGVRHDYCEVKGSVEMQ